MNITEKRDMLITYIEANVAPILIDESLLSLFRNVVTLKSDCSIEQLNGYYVKEEFIIPEWYRIILSRTEFKNNILIIEDITKISKQEQLKFVELFKYRQIGDLKLPGSCVIIIAAKKIDKESIAEEIYSLVAHI